MTLTELEEQLKILHEDNHVIVIVKPQGIPSQADKTGDTDVLTYVKQYLKIKYQKPGNVYCGLVHRLDRPTGGAMVFAKTDKAAARLCEQFREGKITKKYLAVTVGEPRESRGRIQTYLVKDERSNVVKSHVAAVENSKLAILDYKVLDTFEGLSLFDVNLITGRPHQARVQLASLGTPIFGDVKYGKSTVDGAGGNVALWAYSLGFTHPTTQETMVFKVFPPSEEIPWKLFPLEKHINIAKPQ
ncbi:MAG: RNA pseudouridine synthase [Firmicutes bacterium]|nr:RNA pseudouridine synthase [Bacillota bacterium]